jgi:uncharacterized protein YdiU (UPF0061 family)
VTNAPTDRAPIPFDNSFVREMPGFFQKAQAGPVKSPRLVAFDRELAAELRLDVDALDSPLGARYFTGAEVPPGAEPIAFAYAGHQFGHFVPQLGDGRALLLGEVVDVHGVRRDIQLKGSGRTYFSRGGDGLAALGPVLREYLVSGAMHRLGVPTTRMLAAATTGGIVEREEPLPGAVVTRVAASHVRVGTFQYFAARRDVAKVKQLADHVIARHYPELRGRDDVYFALFEAVRDRQAALIARWMLVGFVHGVMNTDNMAVSGETIDFGPCAFMERYDPGTVFSSIDAHGRYAYGNQPALAAWNLARLAECLLPLFDGGADAALERAKQAVADFEPLHERIWLAGMRAKLGLRSAREDDVRLAQDLLAAMQAAEVDYTNALRRLADAADGNDARFTELFGAHSPIDAWLVRWRERCAFEQVASAARAAAMRRVSPAFVPRNHLVEAVLEAAVRRDDFAPFWKLHAVLSRPFDEQPENAEYMEPAPIDAEPYRTFCGT